MRISEVKIKGFRNFKDATISFSKKSLIIGRNDIGKTNLIYALRLLLDKSLPEVELEPQDSDFYVYEDTIAIEIVIRFEDIIEDCILSKFKGMVSDDAVTYIKYKASRDISSGIKSYSILAGKDINSLAELQNGRFYLKYLNMKFIGCYRDLFSYLRREKKRLIFDGKKSRTEEEIKQDQEKQELIQENLETLHNDVNELHYIKRATENINEGLKNLSYQSTALNRVVFDAGFTFPEEFIDNLNLSSEFEKKIIGIGGDGKNNQIYLALWVSRNGNVSMDKSGSIDKKDVTEVNFYCIEEPEAHLHPHQQRKLSRYLYESLDAQVILTTHSPQIVCEFSPDSIIRLYDNKPDTLAADGGASTALGKVFSSFGYRLSIIPAEAFFANVIFLVEGPSEELFYKALSKEIGIDLDQLNISILMVDGVGFEPYVSLFKKLNITYVMRTDNDILKIPKKNEYRFAGFERALEIYKKYGLKNEDILELLLPVCEPWLRGFPQKEPPDVNLIYVELLREGLKNVNIFLAEQDLENDLYNSLLRNSISSFLDNPLDFEIVKEMQDQKATFMFNFLQSCSESLKILEKSSIAEPLYKAQELAKSVL